MKRKKPGTQARKCVKCGSLNVRARDMCPSCLAKDDRARRSEENRKTLDTTLCDLMAMEDIIRGETAARHVSRLGEHSIYERFVDSITGETILRVTMRYSNELKKQVQEAISAYGVTEIGC